MTDEPNTIDAAAAPAPVADAPAPVAEVKPLVDVLADNAVADAALAARVTMIENAIGIFATRVDSLAERVRVLETAAPAAPSETAGDIEAIKSDVDALYRRVLGKR